MPFPEHLDAASAASAGEQMRAAISDRAAVVIADLSATSSCDRAGADALIRAYHAAALSQAELRLVVTAPAVARLVSEAGLDRLVAVFPSVVAASAVRPAGEEAADAPAAPGAPPRPAAGSRTGDTAAGPGLSATVLRQLIDTLDDGILLVDDDGTIVLASRRLSEMFGYEYGELASRPVEALVPADLRAVHGKVRAAYARAPEARPMAGRERLAGVRKDGATLPVTITLSPVPTAGGHLVLAVVRDATRSPLPGDLASLARAAASDREKDTGKLLDRVVSSLFHVGLSLQAAADQPPDVARERISDALRHLDEVIREMRDHAFRWRQDLRTAIRDQWQ